MARRPLRLVLVLVGLVSAAAVAVRMLRVLIDGPEGTPSGAPWPPLAPNEAGPAWAEPSGDACPASHPVKVKLSSGLYHLPGMLAYQRTNADRCYASAEDAEGDGFVRAKR